MSEWKPIDTAPKDGTHVLVYRSLLGKSDCIVEAWWKADVFGDMCWGANGWTYPDFSPPTHWMPLPAPPALTETDPIAQGKNPRP